MRVTIATCCPDHREHSLDWLGWLVAVDAHQVVADLAGRGCDPETITAAHRLYRESVLERVAEAIDFGVELAEAMGSR